MKIRRKSVEDRHKLNVRNIPFLNHVKYLCLIFDKRVTRRLHIRTFAAKASRTFIRACSLFKSSHIRTDNKLTLHKALFQVNNDLWRLRLGVHGRHLTFDIILPAKQDSLYHRWLSKVHADLLTACGFQYSICIRLYYTIMRAASKSSKITKMYIFAIQGKAKPYTEIIRPKFGGGQTYARSRDWAVFIK